MIPLQWIVFFRKLHSFVLIYKKGIFGPKKQGVSKQEQNHSMSDSVLTTETVMMKTNTDPALRTSTWHNKDDPHK